MFARKPPAPPIPALEYQKQLELLYARRTAIDSLIQSLMDYDRLKVKRVAILEEKTA